MCVLTSLQLSETLLILITTEWDSVKNMCWSLSKVQLYMSNFTKTLILAHFQKILKYQIPWKSVHWEPCYSIQTIGQTHTYDANSHLSQFCKHTQTNGMHTAKIIQVLTCIHTKNTPKNSFYTFKQQGKLLHF